MADLLFLALLVAFFALSAVFVHACERMLGTDDSEILEVSEADERVVA